MSFRNIDELNETIIDCTLCPRLVEFRVSVASRPNRFNGQEYWSRPVPGFGQIEGRLLILGLAPAATGANRTGRIFTGDKSSEFLVSCLHEAGFTNIGTSESSDDGLEYFDSYITAAVKCVPPGDKPTKEELKNCSTYLDYEIESMKNLKAVLVLGRIAHDAYLSHLKGKGFDVRSAKFVHGKQYDINGVRLYCSYHPSPRNVNTGRITRDMFMNTLKEIRNFVNAKGRS